MKLCTIEGANLHHYGAKLFPKTAEIKCIRIGEMLRTADRQDAVLFCLEKALRS